jgi:hypothetical protein
MLSVHGETRDGAQIWGHVNFGDISRPGIDERWRYFESSGGCARCFVMSCGPDLGKMGLRFRGCRQWLSDNHQKMHAQSCGIPTGIQSVSLHSDRVIPEVMAFDAAGTRVITLDFPFGRDDTTLGVGSAAGILSDTSPAKKLQVTAFSLPACRFQILYSSSFYRLFSTNRYTH